MSYSEFTGRLRTALVVATDLTDTDFETMLPGILLDAELMCYRDVDFAATRKYERATLGSDSNPANNAIILAPADLVVPRELGFYTPAGSVDATGTYIPLDPVSESFAREYWPRRSTSGTPKYYSLLGGGTASNPFQLLVTPSPDAAYTLEISMTYRPATISATNTTTWLQSNCDDLFFYACMTIAAGYLKNYGASASDPQQAMSWATMYNKAKDTAIEEEKRRRVAGWSNYSNAQPPTAAPQSVK